MYKALNTFIDDLFAFIIKMPTMHRLSCFRDDIIFMIYLYQRWIYPVDPRRIEGPEGPVSTEPLAKEQEGVVTKTTENVSEKKEHQE